MRTATDTTRRPRPRLYEVAMPSPSGGLRAAAPAILVGVFGWTGGAAETAVDAWTEAGGLVCLPCTTFEIAETKLVLAIGRLVAAGCPGHGIAVRPVVPVRV